MTYFKQLYNRTFHIYIQPPPHIIKKYYKKIVWEGSYVKYSPQNQGEIIFSREVSTNKPYLLCGDQNNLFCHSEVKLFINCKNKVTSWFWFIKYFLRNTKIDTSPAKELLHTVTELQYTSLNYLLHWAELNYTVHQWPFLFSSQSHKKIL